MFAALLGFLQALPKLLDLGERLVIAIQDLVKAQQALALKKEFDAAIEEAIKTRDTTKLENILRGKR